MKLREGGNKAQKSFDLSYNGNLNELKTKYYVVKRIHYDTFHYDRKLSQYEQTPSRIEQYTKL